MKADGGHQLARMLLLLVQQTYWRPGPDQGPSLIVARLSLYKLDGQASGCGPHATVTLCPFSIRKWLPSRWLRSAIPPMDGMHFDVIFQVLYGITRASTPLGKHYTRPASKQCRCS
jgi:hypothetical protein